MKQSTIADNLLRMRQLIQQQLPGVVLNYDITDKNTLHIQLHDDEHTITGDCHLNPLHNRENVDNLTWDTIKKWLMMFTETR